MSPERGPKKRKVGNTKTTQTDGEATAELKPDSRVLLDVTIVFATDPNTLFFTTSWKGRQYTGVITDGLSPKTQMFARERAERTATSKNGGVDGQNASLKRGKRLLNRVSERKGRLNPEDHLVFDLPKDATSARATENEPPRPLTRCPHKQCGHIFQSVSEVNHHLIFRHVTEKAVITENTATQSTRPSLKSAGCDPIPELPVLCANCNNSLGDSKPAEVKTEGAEKPPARSPTPFSDISDDAPTLTKEESFEKRDDSTAAARPPLNFTSPTGAKAEAPTSSAASLLKPADILPTTSRSYSNSSTPVSSAVLANKPKTSLNTPSALQLPQGPMGMGGVNPFLSPQAVPSTAPQPPKKAGGSITTGSPFASGEQPPISLAAGVLQQQQMAAGMPLNGLGLGVPPTSSIDQMRHKIHELKGENSSGQSPSTSGLQQPQNASPNPAATNVITSTGSLPRGQTSPFMRPPATAAPPQFAPFFARPPVGINAPGAFLNQQHLMQQLAAMMGSNVPPNSFLPTSAQPK
ncbi:hypothetical protein M3Y99_00360200 [Aphelenchoides fujianensis]|nr:hypothetical protein M3Y99_00360200 [Aphelenchoides fujianensis]